MPVLIYNFVGGSRNLTATTKAFFTSGWYKKIATTKAFFIGGSL
jgi:hypothetical protein